MNLLLDTNALLWWLVDHPRLSRAARATISDPANPVSVSVASFWEIALKSLRHPMEFPERYRDRCDLIAPDSGFLELPITARHVNESRRLAFHHRDPFDRLLIAQARSEGLTIVTSDRVFDRYDVAVVAAE